MIIGHRGARNLWPENTLGGFRRLLGLPVEGVEFDVHLTDAGELLVIHDPTLERTTSGTGHTRALTPAARRVVTLTDSAGEAIPTLDEVLEIYAGAALELHIELKRDAEARIYPGMAAAVIERIEAHGVAARSILTSFDVAELETVRSSAPRLRTLISLNHKSAELHAPSVALERAEQAADLIAIQMSYLEEHWELATSLMPLDRLGVWVPNADVELAYWLNRGLRQVTTDRPDLALAARRG
jgi:glycerophosphoryl diester phosphodiesterase